MARPILRLALVAPALLLIAGGCTPSTYGLATTVEGQGAVTAETRATTPFRRIRVGDGVRLDARTGRAASVSVTAEASLLRLITTTVTDDELEVALAVHNVTTHEPMTVTVVTPELAAISLDAGASGTIDVSAPSLELEVTRGSSIAGSGSVHALDLHAGLGGSAELGGVHVDQATVSIDGGGQATIAADGSVAGVVGAGGNLVLATRPSRMRVDVRAGGTMLDG
jgi:hypothetical protein